MDNRNQRGGVFAFGLPEPKDTLQSLGIQNKTAVNFYDTPKHGEESDISSLVIDGDIGVNALTVQCYVDSIVHGTMADGPDSTPASLIVFHFVFAPRITNRRFIAANIQIQFTGASVTKIAPDGEWETSPTATTIQVDNTISPSLQANLGAVTPGISYKWDRSVSSTDTNYIYINGLIKALGDEEADAAIWDLSENDQSDSGIPSLFQTAVLLQRDPKEPLGKFQAALKIHCDVHAQLGDKLKIHGFPGCRSEKEEREAEKGKASSDTMTLYYNAAHKNINPQNIDAKNLAAVKLADFQSLVDVRLWADGSKPAPAASAAPVAAAKPAAASLAAPAAGAA
ncbi:hypothetical protein F503_05135 [Ophiostoma piceae UAMH 11346]|uniref:Uncharacterized protein n=1 Tax=Ophiostoma piceae (strain UAMH 11346) TaxID=1262450 RepID=S3D968_OPHP1|nr:hypothetical protein F503_05135 [Ophiostoma piceae UAMH 11346]